MLGSRETKLIMKSPKFSFTLVSLTFIVFFFSGCSDECETTSEFVIYEPVYESMASFRDDVRVSESKSIDQAGKIYFKDGFLFINEPNAGIHVIDNRDISNPTPLSFIEIPGNFDIAAKGNYLYADSYVDMVVFDISDLNSISEVNRQEDIFLSTYEWDGMYQNGMVLIDYNEEIVKSTAESDCQPNIVGCPNCLVFDMANGAESFDIRTAATNSSSTGVGGSMARFTIKDDYLYTLDQIKLRSFDLADLVDPQLINEVDVGWGMETIFPYENHLFIGARNGMFIYNIDDPALPSYVSQYNHFTACDPVVVQGNYAYVTLRDGTECNTFSNQLDVIDISNISSPRLVNVVEMQNPHGLGIDGSCLFVCEGDFGLKFFDASDVMDIENKMVRHYKDVHAYDVIPLNNNLMMIGEDGLRQYGYSCNGEDLLLMSTIPTSSSF